eukprot:773188-Pelagomonas_calceolata.AAC.1
MPSAIQGECVRLLNLPAQGNTGDSVTKVCDREGSAVPPQTAQTARDVGSPCLPLSAHSLATHTSARTAVQHSPDRAPRDIAAMEGGGQQHKDGLMLDAHLGQQQNSSSTKVGSSKMGSSKPTAQRWAGTNQQHRGGSCYLICEPGAAKDKQ